MQNFLDNILNDLESQEDDLSKFTFVLPSKRAGVFLKNRFKARSKKTSILPRIISLEEFIENLTQLTLIEQTSLLFELYKVYLQSPILKHDSFDEFSKWANMLIQDFNEINRHLIDTAHLFPYLTDVKRIEQLLQQESTTELINNQLRFYSEMPFLFEQLNANLLNQDLAYQGLQYKIGVDNIDSFIKHNDQQFVFAGFNALNKAEETIFEKLYLAKQAVFYWDLDQFFVDQNHNAALFIKRYIQRFESQGKIKWLNNDFTQKKDIEIIGVPKKIGQVKQVSEILSKHNAAHSNMDGVALVLADEALLAPMLTSLPIIPNGVNITMGLGIKNLPLTTLFDVLFKLHLDVKSNQFNYKHVIAILRYANQLHLLSSSSVLNSIEHIKTNNILYLRINDLIKIDPSLKKIAFLFESWDDDCQLALENIIGILNHLINKRSAHIILEESKHKLLTLFQQLLNLNSDFRYFKSIKTLYHYYQQLLIDEKLSFKGEPLSGLQIMGLLETRALDFDTVIITSVNEQILPAGKSTNSFIPFDIKKEYKLPTYVEKNAIFSYHFFRLLHRAKKIYLLYNVETDDFGSGEQSRFLTQLQFYKKDEILHKIVGPQIISHPNKFKAINKSNPIMVRLKEIANKGFSATTLISYIRDPFDFYKKRVLKIRNVENVDEIIAANTLGTIIHKSLEELYRPILDQTLSVEYLKKIKVDAESVIKKYFIKEYKYGNIETGKNLLIFHVAKQFIQNFIHAEIGQIKSGNTIILKAVEKKVEMQVNIEGFEHPVKLIGEIDRIDTYNDTLRIIDYKTGVVETSELMCKDWSTLISNKDKSKAFQVLFYAYLYVNDAKFSLEEQSLESGVISFKRLKNGFVSINKGSLKKEDINAFKIQLDQLILEIFNPTVPFQEKEIISSKF